MQTIKQKSINIAAKVIKQMGEFELLGWPPSCMGTFYQPERPKTLVEQNESINADKTNKKY